MEFMSQTIYMHNTSLGSEIPLFVIIFENFHYAIGHLIFSWVENTLNSIWKLILFLKYICLNFVDYQGCAICIWYMIPLSTTNQIDYDYYQFAMN
jgi:hypothetical protein